MRKLALHLGIERAFSPAKKTHPALAIEGYAEPLSTLAGAGYELQGNASIHEVTRRFRSDPFGNRIELISTDAVL
jgi:hypothetical protein